MVLGKVARGTLVEPYVRSGKEAIKGEHRDRISASQGCMLSDTADLEAALGSLSSGEPQWAYAVGWISTKTESCCFVEVHPANTQHVDDLVRKKTAAARLLRQHAPRILELSERTRARLDRPVWIWITTDAHVGIHPATPASRRLREAGISRPSRHLELR
jgi:hypothetical protein